MDEITIAIDGNIGCGKSTLLKSLQEFGHRVYPEELDSWGDWLHKYYENPSRYALGFQMTVLLSHLKQQTEWRGRGVGHYGIFERCSHTCNRIFGSMLVDDGIMDSAELELCKQYETTFNQRVNKLFYLQTTPKICKSRMISRDRACESSINIEYLQKLHDKYESVYNNGTNVVDGIEVHVIDATGSPQSVLDQITILLEGGVVI